MNEIKQLLKITESLRKKFSHLGINFSLDGKLVGDIGEVLAAKKYGLKLFTSNTPVHDGEEISTGRKVQIKSSFKNYSYFPYGESQRPDYFLAINILENGDLEELFNGLGHYVYEHYILARALKPYNKTYYTLSKGILKKLNGKVAKADKIQIVKCV